MCAHSMIDLMVHSHEFRTGQQQGVLQGGTLRLFFANVGLANFERELGCVDLIASNLLHRSDGKLHHSAASREEFKTQH